MNNTTNQKEIPEKPRRNSKGEETGDKVLMTLEEMQNFVMHLVFSSMSEAYKVDMLLHLFKSISSLIMKDKTDAADMMDDLARYVYTDISQHGFQSYYKYHDGIAERIRTFGYSFTEDENFDKIKREVSGTDSPYIVHSTESIEELISRTMKHPQMTSGLNHAIVQYLRENSKNRSNDFLEIESPEFIKAAMCNELCEHADGTPMSDEDLAKVRSEQVLDLLNHPTAEGKCLDLAKTVNKTIADPETDEEIRARLKLMVDEMVTGGLPEYSPEVVEAFLCAPVNDVWCESFTKELRGDFDNE